MPMRVLRQCRRFALYLSCPVSYTSPVFSMIILWARDKIECLPDGVSCAQTDPLRDGAILLLCFGELLFCAKGFVALNKTVGISGGIGTKSISTIHTGILTIQRH